MRRHERVRRRRLHSTTRRAWFACVVVGVLAAACTADDFADPQLDAIEDATIAADADANAGTEPGDAPTTAPDAATTDPDTSPTDVSTSGDGADPDTAVPDTVTTADSTMVDATNADTTDVFDTADAADMTTTPPMPSVAVSDQTASPADCGDVANAEQRDLDGDGVSDAFDSDLDGDAISNIADNCRLVFNPDQSDANSDGVGDVCDGDFDGDGILDGDDDCSETPNPDTVVIDEVVLPTDGWLVVRADDAGNIGSSIGVSALLSAGTSTDVSVTLVRDVVDGETLYAMLHEDNPADGGYTFDGQNGEDGPVLDANGMVIAPPFVVSLTPSASVHFTGQTLGLSTIVTVDDANVLVDGHIVIHEDDGGTFGPVIGSLPVTTGATGPFTVELDRPVLDGETLYAMLHSDDGNGVYDDAATDPPVTDNDGMVVVVAAAMTVTVGTPAIRFTIGSNGATGYTWTGVEPSWAESDIAGGLGGEDVDITLRSMWRYEIVNTLGNNHPLGIGDLGAAQATDVIYFSQLADPAEESTASVDWVNDGDNVLFTVDFGALTVDGYRCEVHTSNMRGGFIIQ